ncbi:mechanosensitive ion channel domain-containing protein [Thermomonas sp.]|uniref:mechanosensitive ion channel family protein n=1 Tax=Thermomonas sp. TaxID=1971895 RepID=UPI002487CF0B|nr:mechanosensitive ion channel domain-containing protein [Thermomonas sp.]MDI1253417.1 mechanosensitive ion channel [Thermomonas sp.]
MTNPIAKSAAGFDPRAWLTAGLADKAIDFVAALLIVLVGWWLARWISRLLDKSLVKMEADEILRSFLRNIAFAALMVVVLIAALQKVGVPTTSLLAMVGAAGLAIGLALKDSLSNIASGLMLIVQRPFKAGDAVQVGGVEGVVEQVRIFTTRLRTYQNELVVLPNSEITTKPIINFTYKPLRRADITVGIGYGERVDRAREVLLAVAKANPEVLRKPATEVLVTGLGESSVDLVLRAWIKTEVFVQTRSELTEAVHREFTDAGINIPYPQRDVHVYQHAGKDADMNRSDGDVNADINGDGDGDDIAKAATAASN